MDAWLILQSVVHCCQLHSYCVAHALGGRNRASPPTLSCSCCGGDTRGDAGVRVSSVAGRYLGEVLAWAASSIAASCPELFGQPRRMALSYPAVTCCCSAGCCPQLAAPAHSVFCPSFCLRSFMLLAARCTAALLLLQFHAFRTQQPTSQPTLPPLFCPYHTPL